tara:strand:+ start:559 stop:1239 length:681 start_codon:yes stop_codon:yes gene_type:complete
MLKLFQKIETAVSYILSNSINEKKFLKKKLNKKEIIVIDIGANVGSYLDFIIKNFKYKKIYAFEPSVKAYRQLKNKFNSKNIILENIALSNKKTKRKFYEYKLTSQSSFYKITSKKNPFKNLNNIYKVKTLKLDEYLNLKEKKIDICKIDIQGEELNVLMGMQKYLKKKKIKLIKVEITIRNDYDNNKNQFVEIINFLKKFNYDLVTISKIKFSQNEIMFLDAYFQ